MRNSITIVEYLLPSHYTILTAEKLYLELLEFLNQSRLRMHPNIYCCMNANILKTAVKGCNFKMEFYCE